MPRAAAPPGGNLGAACARTCRDTMSCCAGVISQSFVCASTAASAARSAPPSIVPAPLRHARALLQPRPAGAAARGGRHRRACMREGQSRGGGGRAASARERTLGGLVLCRPLSPVRTCASVVISHSLECFIPLPLLPPVPRSDTISARVRHANCRCVSCLCFMEHAVLEGPSEGAEITGIEPPPSPWAACGLGKLQVWHSLHL
jgi:hypothetical protein